MAGDPTGTVLSFAERFAAKRRDLEKAARAYFEACSEQHGGNPLEKYGLLGDAAIEFGRMAATQEKAPLGKMGASCEDTKDNVEPLFERAGKR